MELSADDIRAFSVFFPYAFKKHAEMRAKNGRLVHYTTAEAAVNIAKTNQIWMRSSTTVNDYMEIEHGLKCLATAYNGKTGAELKKVLDELFPGFCKDLEDRINSWAPHFRTDTYITCVSEHLPEEDKTGRLSMWRAYGGTTGVAIVLNHRPFLDPSDALGAYSSPVAYLNEDEFDIRLCEVLSLVQGNKDFLKYLGRDKVMANVFSMMRFAVLCTKHPDFAEEREWRVVYSPKFQASKRLLSDVVTIGGAPQRIFKIPLEDVPEEGLKGINIPEFVDRVIIGPSQHPFAVRDAIVALLKDAKVENPEGKVWVSDIPLRK